MVTIVLFDKNYNFIDVAYAQAGSGSSGAFAQVTASYKVREAGFGFLYISNENPMMADAYFDDVQMSYVPSRILQYNEYYPFGLQTASSWTRDGAAANSYLANGGSEINSATKLYDLDFRNYDPALGRLHQIDLMADKYSSMTPYNFTFNNPENLTDKSGLDPSRYMFTFMDDDVQNSRQGGLFWRSNDQAWPTAPAPPQSSQQKPGQTNAEWLYELAYEAGDGIHVYTNDGNGNFKYNEAATSQSIESYGLASFRWYGKPDANDISAEGRFMFGGQAPSFNASQDSQGYAVVDGIFMVNDDVKSYFKYNTSSTDGLFVQALPGSMGVVAYRFNYQNNAKTLPRFFSNFPISLKRFQNDDGVQIPLWLVKRIAGDDINNALGANATDFWILLNAGNGKISYLGSSENLTEDIQTFRINVNYPIAPGKNAIPQKIGLAVYINLYQPK